MASSTRPSASLTCCKMACQAGRIQALGELRVDQGMGSTTVDEGFTMHHRYPVGIWASTPGMSTGNVVGRSEVVRATSITPLLENSKFASSTRRHAKQPCWVATSTLPLHRTGTCTHIAHLRSFASLYASLRAFGLQHELVQVCA